MTATPRARESAEPEPAQAGAVPARAERPRKRVIATLVFGVALLAAVPLGIRLWQYYQTHESTDDAYVVADIVPLSSRVAGTVAEVYVDGNDPVAAEQILARLDSRDLEARVRQARAAVDVAAARLRTAELEVTLARGSTGSDAERTSATLRVARSTVLEAQHGTEEVLALKRTREAAVAACEADVESRTARLDVARTAFDRARLLREKGVVSPQHYDEAEGALRAARAEQRASRERLAQARSEADRVEADLRTRRQAVERTRAGVAEARALVAGSTANLHSVEIREAEVEVTRALLAQTEADLLYAELQLSYAELRAPVAGVIARKNLEIGQVVQPGRPLLAIVPLGRVWVEANFKETQLSRMKPGQTARLEVDAYPDDVFTGTVASISPGTGAVFSLLPPENATGNFVKVVQRVPVKIVIDGDVSSRRPLRPGMSVIANVTTR